MIRQLTVRTNRAEELVKITDRVQSLVNDAGVEQGICTVFVPHTTAGVTINEGADPDVATDLLAALDRIVPRDLPYKHGEGNSPSHVKASLMGSSVTVIIAGGRLQLGTWQAVFFCEFDGPRQRTVWVDIREA